MNRHSRSCHAVIQSYFHLLIVNLSSIIHLLTLFCHLYSGSRNSERLRVTRWLLHDHAHMTLSNDEVTPTFYQTLAGVTHLEESDIIELEKRYWMLKTGSKTGR